MAARHYNTHHSVLQAMVFLGRVRVQPFPIFNRIQNYATTKYYTR